MMLAPHLELPHSMMLPSNPRTRFNWDRRSSFPSCEMFVSKLTILVRYKKGSAKRVRLRMNGGIRCLMARFQFMVSRSPECARWRLWTHVLPRTSPRRPGAARHHGSLGVLLASTVLLALRGGCRLTAAARATASAFTQVANYNEALELVESSHARAFIAHRWIDGTPYASHRQPIPVRDGSDSRPQLRPSQVLSSPLESMHAECQEAVEHRPRQQSAHRRV